MREEFRPRYNAVIKMHVFFYPEDECDGGKWILEVIGPDKTLTFEYEDFDEAKEDAHSKRSVFTYEYGACVTLSIAGEGSTTYKIPSVR